MVLSVVNAHRCVVFFVAVFSVCAAWSFVYPPYGVSDEPAHTVKAVATGSGQFTGPQTIGQFDYPATVFEVPAAYTSVWHFTCYNGDVNATPACVGVFPIGSDRVPTPSTAGRYPPSYYLLIGWLGNVVPSETGFYLMRLLSGLIVSAGLTVAFHFLGKFPNPQRSQAALAVCCTPAVVSFGGTINPFALEVAAAAVFWTTGTLLLANPDPNASAEVLPRGAIVAFLASAFLFGSVRPASFIWMAIATVTLVLFHWRVLGGPGALVRGHRRWFSFGAMGGLVLSLAWWKLVMGAASLGGNAAAGGTLIENVRASFERSDEYFQQMFGYFGWTTFYAPVVVTVLFVLALAVLCRSDGARSRLEIATISLLGIFVVFAPAVLEGARAKSEGFGYQGRYMIPVAIGVPVLASLLDRQRAAADRRSYGAVYVLCAVGVFIATQHAARRFFVGLSGDYLWVGRALWWPPLGTGGVVALMLLGAAAMASLGFGTREESRDSWRLAVIDNNPAPNVRRSSRARLGSDA